MKLSKKRKAFIAVLSVFAVSASSVAIISGCNKVSGRIDAPERIEADLGTYVIPEYDVVDKNGIILAGYNVYLKSATNSSGDELDVSYEAVTVTEAGIYEFVYSAGRKNVSDVTVTIDFADRTAPTINLDERNLPAFFIKGNSYKMPAYTLSGDYAREKCWAKVYYIAPDKSEAEVPINNTRFSVEESEGSYAIRIHVEDAVGNVNDYEYIRKVDSPETLVKDRVLYFNEEFGAKQVNCHESSYKGKFVTEFPANAPDGNTEGAYEITFDGVSKTENNEGYVSIDVPALLDITDYEQLEMWVYYEGNDNIVMGSNWWNDTAIEKGKWVKMVWSTRVWGEYPAGASGSMDVTNNKPVGTNDITGMSIRIIFDYKQTVIPNGKLYFSSMNAVPKLPANVEAKENVILDTDKFFKGDTVNISAKKIDGKTVDCFLLNGKVLPGNSFVITEDANTVEVRYIDGEMTNENMSWATPDFVAPVGGDAQVYKLGESKNWALYYDVYNMSSACAYTAAYVGGSDQLLGFEINGTSGKFAGYGAYWKWMDGVALSDEVIAAFRAATEDKPVTVKYLRSGSVIKAFVEYDGKEYFIAAVDISSDLQVRSGDSFGLGGRKPVDVGGNLLHNGSVKNIRAVATAAKTELVHATYAATLTKGDDLVDFADKDYRIGDKVKLSAPKQNGDKLFLCYEVNGKKIDGDTFYIADKNVTVKAIYVDACVITLGTGLYIGDKTGNVTVPVGTVVTIIYKGTSPEGQYFAGIYVDGNLMDDISFTTTATSHNITVSYADRIENDNEKLNETDKAGETGGLVYHPTQSGWKPSEIEHVTDFGYDGEDKTVDADNSLKVTLSGAEQAFALTNGVNNLDKYKELYFYVYSEKGGIAVGGWWCRDVVTVAGKWVKVSFGRDKTPWNIDEKSVWEKGLNNFVYSFNGAQAGDVVYVTSVYGVPYEDVTVTKDETSSQYLEISAPKYGAAYKQNETVTLTCKGAPANKAFVCFTVNGADIDGNEYKLTADGVEFGIRFADASTITFEDGASAADGGNVFGKGAVLKLTHEAKTGKVFDYYLIDGTLKVFTDKFKTSESTHTVKAVYADNAASITWGEGDADRYAKDKVMGNTATSEWFKTKFDGQIFGSAEYWAIKVNVKTNGENKWNALTFVTGSKESLLMRWYSGSDLYFSFSKLDEQGNEYAPANTPLDYSFVADMGTRTPEQIAFRKMMSGKLSAGTDITVVRCGNEIKVFADNQQVLTIKDVIDCTGNWLGIGTGFDPDAPALSGLGFITGKDKVETYLDNTGTISIEGNADGSLVKYSGTAYTLPTAKVLTLSGKENSSSVTVVVKDARNNVLAQANGKITIPDYKGSQYITITYSADGCKDHTVKVYLQKADTGVLLEANALGAANLNANGNTVAYSTEQRYGSEAGSIKISNIANNETGIFLNKSETSRFIEFYAYTADSGIQMGAWWCCNHTLAVNKWTHVVLDTRMQGYDVHGGEAVLRIFGSSQGKTVYISSVKTFDDENSDALRLTDISYAKNVASIRDFEYVTDKQCTGDADRPVSEAGSLKVTVDGSDNGLAASVNFTVDLSNFSEVYFYVYTDAANASAGAYWCGNTALATGQWTRVSLTADMANGGPWNVDGSKIFEAGLKDMVVRLMDCSAGDVFYVTSLYGVPKA